MNIVRSVAAETVAGDEMIHDLVQPALQSVFVTADQVEHVCRQRDQRIRRVALQGAIGGIQFNDEAIAQYDADRGLPVEFKSADLERLHGSLCRGDDR